MCPNVLVTGNNGYIGSVLVPELMKNQNYFVTGLDTNYYGANYTKVDQVVKDIRNIDSKDLNGIFAVIHLAALSNDALCKINPELTMKINCDATIRLAKLAKENGVRRFIFTSSQSIYGDSKIKNKELEEDDPKNPVTSYGESKLKAEEGIKRLNSRNFITTCIRPSSVFGSSPNLRCDIVLNDLVCSGYTTNKIVVKSDGEPWRPVIHIRDVSKAIINILEAPEKTISGQSYNLGVEGRNYQIKELAKVAKKVVPMANIVFAKEKNPDTRDYKMSFRKFSLDFKNFRSEWDLNKGGLELLNYLGKIKFSEENYRSNDHNRINKLLSLIEDGKLDEELYWK